MSKKLNAGQKARAAALEVALAAVARSGDSGGITSWTAEPEEVLQYAKFVLGKPKKRRRRRPDATGHAEVRDGRAYWAPAGTPLPGSLEDLEAKGWRPLGYLTEDGLKEDSSFRLPDSTFRAMKDALAGVAVPTIAAATLERFAEQVRDGDLAAEPERPASTFRTRVRTLDKGWHMAAAVDVLDQGKARGCGGCAEELERRGLTDLDKVDPWETSTPEPAGEEQSAPIGEDPGDAGILRAWTEAIFAQNVTREAAREAAELEAAAEENVPGCCGSRFPESCPGPCFKKDEAEREESVDVLMVSLDANASPEEKRAAEEKLGFVPGALDEELNFSPEGVFFSDGTPAEKARADELERRASRDKALKLGREKLAMRRADPEKSLGVALDDDELLAVAGTEVYPAGDEEPSREVRIRNRQGWVWKWHEERPANEGGSVHFLAGWGPVGSASTGTRAWSWTDLELVRRGPWHVV